jgi:hypothetical protein
MSSQPTFSGGDGLSSDNLEQVVCYARPSASATEKGGDRVAAAGSSHAVFPFLLFALVFRHLSRDGKSSEQFIWRKLAYR